MSNVTEVKGSGRRGFLRKLVVLTGSAGVAGFVLDRFVGKSTLPTVQAGGSGGNMTIDGANTGSGTTSLSSAGNPALTATNTSNGAALQGTCTAGTGVLGTTTTGTGVQGTASSSTGVAVAGFAGDPGAVPIVAQGSSGQSANLQEWRSGLASALSVVDSSGRLGVGLGSPGFNVHVLGTTDPASITVDGVGIVGPNFQFRRARGTAASPSAVLSGDGILFLVAKGYGSTGFSAGGRANVSMFAGENWTDTAQGTYMVFKTTQAGTTTQTEKMRITDTGNIVPPSDGAGSVGVNGQRWGLVRAVTVTPGDLVFENGLRATEEGGGLAFKNDEGEKIAVLDRKGNFHIKGKFMEDL